MFEITGQPVFVISVTLAVALPILIAIMWSRRSTKTSGGPRFVLVVAGRIGVILLAQLLAMTSIFLSVNNEFQFYSSWADLFGVSSGPPPPIRTNNVSSGTGSVEVMGVHAKSGVTADTLVWLPPGYTECVDVPNGPQAETWLSTDVPVALQAKYRVEPPGRHWSLMGWSAGGLCVAKMLLKYPATFSAAVSLGGSFQAYLDNTTGDLFGGNAQLQNENSSIWLYNKHGMRGGKLLMVSGRQDAWSWNGTTQMSLATNGDPNVTLVSFPRGGHNYRSYKPYVPQGLEWLGKSGAIG